MSDSSFEFDPTREEGSHFDPLPAGVYTAEITDACVAPTKKGNAKMLKLTWRVIMGEYENRLVWQQLVFQHAESARAVEIGRAKIKDTCDALGIAQEVRDLAVFKFKPALITLAIEQSRDEYPDKNVIRRVLPLPKVDPSKPKSPHTPSINPDLNDELSDWGANASGATKATSSANSSDDDLPFK